MHWLQPLDNVLFHFANRSLSNPFFDWLMPVLSGQNVPWLFAVLVAAPFALLLGSTRLRLCVLLMLLVVASVDPLIVGTLKDAMARPRPFVVLPEARHFGLVGDGYTPALPDGTLPAGANTHSFPSAHAANWFAMAAVAFVFYRRSAWFMFPLAAAVAFSRVYNGVHYPSDVLAGAVLGAGYAFALLLLAQIAWNWIGKRFFPGWHARLPNCLAPNPAPAAAAGCDSEWFRLGLLTIALALAGRWAYLASGHLGLSEDEAYQWLWSKHLALSYYSKPPGIAYIQWLGTTLFGDTNFGVRFFSPVFAALLSLLIFRFMAREVGPRPAYCLLLITFATPLLVAGSTLMTVDPPLVLCWMWAVVAGWRAVQAGSQTRDWLVVGLALGLGFLCKYTAMLQLVCWLVYFALQPAARAQLRQKGPWLALLIFSLCTLPVIIWNTQHDWITLSDLTGDAGLHHRGESLTLAQHAVKSLNYFLEFTGGELGMLNPIFFVGAVAAMVIAWRRRTEKPFWFFLLCLSAPLFLGYWLWSFHSRVQLNWIAASIPPLFCLMIAVWRESKMPVKPWLALGLVLGVTASVFMYDSDLPGRMGLTKLPGDLDPAHRVRGGREAALLVEAERAKFEPAAFILADHYGRTGIYSFYSPRARDAARSNSPLVYCLDSETPIDQFPFWNSYDYRAHRRGQNALFVLWLDPYKPEPGWFGKWLHHQPVAMQPVPPPPVPPRVAAQFESVTNLGVREIKLSDGRVFHRVELFGCYNLK
jgi:membrane-associated phospholipid phosphatase